MDWKEEMRSGLDHWIQLCSTDEPYIWMKQQLMELREDIEDEMTVMIAGEFNAGKSTFINALLGQKVLSTNVTPETAMVTKLTYGEKRKVMAHFLDGRTQVFDDAWMEQLTAERDGEFKEVRHQLSYVELQIPAEILKEMTIIDSPGLNANNEYHTEVTERFLGRADFAIFLFHALYVGSATELKWLKKFNDHGISPYGIINRIDELNDDQLEDLIDYSHRRFGQAVAGLFGVSALDALDGKLQGNDELLQWSNWREVEALLNHLKKKSDRKIERAYTRLTEPIKQMDQLFLDWKMSLPVNKLDSDRVKQFSERDFPELLPIKEQLDYYRMMTGTVHESWHQILHPSIDSVESTGQFLRSFMEQFRKMGSRTALARDPLQEWDGMVFNQYQPFAENRQEYHLMVDKGNREREKLENHWKNLDDSHLLFKKQRLIKHKNNLLIFNEAQSELERKRRDLTVQFNEMNTKVNELESYLQSFIAKDINAYAEQEYMTLKTWNSQLAETKKSFLNISQNDIDSIEDFSLTLLDFLENAAGPLLAAGKSGESFLAYAEASYLFGNMANLKQGLPPNEFYSQWRRLVSFSQEKEAQYDVHFPKLLPPELLFHELKAFPAKLKHDVDSEINRIIAARNRRIKRGSGAAAVLLLVIGALWLNRYDHEDQNDSLAANEYSTEEGLDVSEVDYEGQLSEEDKQRLAEQFPAEDIESFLRAVHPQLNDNTYSNQDLFIESGWSSYQPFYHAVAHGEQISLAVANIEYLSNDEIQVAVTETYGNDGVEQEYATNYTLVPDSTSGDELRISAFSSELTNQTETEIPLAEGDMTAFLENFRSDYMQALNEGNSAYINQYFEQNSPAHKELREYIASIAGHSYRFEQLEFRVDGVSKNDVNRYTAAAFEKFTFTDDQDEKTMYERSKDYIVKVLPGKRLIIDKITITNTKKETITEPTVQLVSNQTVMDFIRRYYSALEMAFNGNGFSYVQSYYDPNSTIYTDTETYIHNANSKNMSMDNLDMHIESVAQNGDSHYLVTVVLTDEYFYQDGTGDRKKIRAQYKVQVTNTGNLMISENPPVQILEETAL